MTNLPQRDGVNSATTGIKKNFFAAVVHLLCKSYSSLIKQFCVPVNSRKFDFISDVSDGATLGF